MKFDARTAKLLTPGEHLTIEECPGLRIEASAMRRAWTYRYRSPVDGRMRQIRLGLWPAMTYPAALAQWEVLRKARDSGEDPALLRRQSRQAQIESDALASQLQRNQTYSVRRLCEDYLKGHVDRQRKAKGAAEVRRMFDTMLHRVADDPAAALTRSQAFELLETHQPLRSCAPRPDHAGSPSVEGQADRRQGDWTDQASLVRG